MVCYGGGIVVRDRQSAFRVDEVADERRVEDEGLRADFVAGHAFRESGDFVGGECFGPDADIGNVAAEI